MQPAIEYPYQMRVTRGKTPAITDNSLVIASAALRVNVSAAIPESGAAHFDGS